MPSEGSRDKAAKNPVGFAIVGCGFVADFYMVTRNAYPDLRPIGAWDIVPERLAAFCRRHGVRAYESLEALLSDEAVALVLNLTNPRAHFEVTQRCLQADKHVYSEKPLAMTSDEAAELVCLASTRRVMLACAPCSLLSQTAQTMSKALREGIVGRVRLVYANFDDGMVHRLNPSRWRSASGASWPARDEFEVGCTYEHAGYVLSWLALFFGPARRVHAFASCQLPDKGVEVTSMAPDFSVGCIEYDHGVVARVTCSIVAPEDKSITIVGDEGVLYTRTVRDDFAPVYVRPTPPSRLAAAASALLHEGQRLIEARLPFSFGEWRLDRRYPSAGRAERRSLRFGKPVDFMRGPAELARSLNGGQRCRLSPELGHHLLEVVEALQWPGRFGGVQTITSEFPSITPLAGAMGTRRNEPSRIAQ
jgi:predicted dehydrogenase